MNQIPYSVDAVDCLLGMVDYAETGRDKDGKQGKCVCVCSYWYVVSMTE